MSEERCRFFTVKCEDMAALHHAWESCSWPCPDRIFDTHTRVDSKDHKITFILIFGVIGCRGWYGYAVTEDNPLLAKADEILEASNIYKEKDHHNVKIKWLTSLLAEHDGKSLPFSRTRLLQTVDGRMVNKCDNFSEVPKEVGKEMCEHIDQYCGRLTRKKQELVNNQPQLGPSMNDSGNEMDTESSWENLLGCVGNMGCILLACPFGSQRYNLHTRESDMDMFVVYAADTAAMLGFSPPQTTIKNKRSEAHDYTIHEVHRFCELLVSGDPQCVETLFLNPASYIVIEDNIRQLSLHRKKCLNRKCLDGYLRHATGGKGMKLLERLQKSPEADQMATRRKISRLYCLIIRLLQNARDVAKGDDLLVYRPDNSLDRDILMKAKQCECSFEYLDEIVSGLLHEIDELRAARWPESQEGCSIDSDETMDKYVTDWLMKLRYDNFTQYMQIQGDISHLDNP